MNKITQQQLQDYVSELGEFDKEFRKGSSFYAWSTYTFKQDDIDTLKAEDIDASEFLNVCVTLNGMWDDNWGCDWTDMDFCKVEEYQELVPEQIIPAHYVVRVKSTPFTPDWKED